MTISEEAMAAFESMDDQNQREMLKILNLPAARAPRRRPANLYLVAGRGRGDNFLDRASRLNNELPSVFVGRPQVADKA